MAIANITQIIDLLPLPPHRGQEIRTIFVNKQEAFQDALSQVFIDQINELKGQLNTFAEEVNTTVTTMNGLANTATTQAGIATTQAGIATTQAGIATTRKNEVQGIYDNFDARYLGSKSSDPVVDNKGNPLVDGALYLNSISNLMKFYDLGTTTWVALPSTYLSGLLDVQLTSLSNGHSLKWNGSKWINFDIQATYTPRASSTTANKLPKYSDTIGTQVESNLYSNAGGDLGLDTSPSLWHSSVRAFETKAGALFNYLTSKLSLIQNAYYSVGGNYYYKTTAPATMLEQENGEFKFYTAPSGTVGTSVTFTERMKLDNLGKLNISKVGYKDTPISITSWNYSSTTITLTVASHSFIIGDTIEVAGLTTTDNGTGTTSTYVPNGIWVVSNTTANTIIFIANIAPTVTNKSVSSATVKGIVLINGIYGSLGIGQAWTDMTTKRSLGVTYTNTSGKPILVLVSSSFGAANLNMIVDGTTVWSWGTGTGSFNISGMVLVPVNGTYSVTMSNVILAKWLELR